MLVQTDATARVAAERALQRVLEAEHALLAEVFPRQVLEAITAGALRQRAAGGGIGGNCGGGSGGGTALLDGSSGGAGAGGGVMCPGGANAGGGCCGGAGVGANGAFFRGLNLALAHESVTVLFADIVGFTAAARGQPAAAVMDFLNDLFTR